MPSPGVQHYTRAQVAKETTPGTAMAATRMLYPDATGYFSQDPMLVFHDDANRGTKTHVASATSLGTAAAVRYATPANTGISYDELVILGGQLRGGQTGSGGTAAKAWYFTPDQDAQTTQDALTWEVGDDFMQWRMEYGQARRFRISWSQDSLTMAEADWFGRQLTIMSSFSTVTPTNPVRIPGKMWTVKFATSRAGLVPASAESALLLDADLDITTGLVPRRYSDGTGYHAQSVEAEPLDFTLTMHVEGVSAASTRYGKWLAKEVDFVRLANASDVTLGSTRYKAEIDLAVLWTNVQPIASADEGVNVWELTGRAAYDATWDNSIQLHVVNSITAMPGI